MWWLLIHASDHIDDGTICQTGAIKCDYISSSSIYFWRCLISPSELAYINPTALDRPCTYIIPSIHDTAPETFGPRQGAGLQEGRSSSCGGFYSMHLHLSSAFSVARSLLLGLFILDLLHSIVHAYKTAPGEFGPLQGAGTDGDFGYISDLMTILIPQLDCVASQIDT